MLDTLHIALFNVLYDLRSHVDVSSWKDVNGPEFEYLGEEERPLSAVGLYKSTPKLLRQGFLCSYAKFRIQDDYGSFARWHFMKRKELEGFAAKHPRIRKKYDLFLKYYRSHGLLKGDKQTKHRNTATKPAAQPNR
ncbi:MAG: hypothetical protein QGG42_15070 [Phycisphaerae bacterium]|nr:hypothetical protein [Phycisphaerae bacterium]